MPQLGKIAGKSLGFLGSKALSPSLPSFAPSPNIRTPAFNLTGTPGGNVTLQRLAGPQRFTDILADLADVRGEVKPGFGRFTEAAVTALGEARNRALGTARDILTRRRVMGASFSTNQLASIERAFGIEEEKVRSSALLQEIETTRVLIDQSFRVNLEGLRLDLDELRLATGVSDSILQVMSQQAVIDKQLAAKAIEGVGGFFGGEGGIGELFGDFGDQAKDLATQAAIRFAVSQVGG